MSFTCYAAARSGQKCWTPPPQTWCCNRKGRDGVDVRIEEEIAEIIGKQGQVTGVVTTRGDAYRL